MRKRRHLPSDKKGERDPLLTRVSRLAPLLAALVRLLELALKWVGIIQ
ncbi:hypothetical protein FACS1894167_04820 [Synergistales bacterium]|nr:hypothetical protein FACS1894167_04820 [Synergistales bacterium]GHV57310.1 hypothetical protein FACS1894216_21790 [Synergistales bacterium]